MFINLFQKNNCCFICRQTTNSYICSSCRKELAFYQELRGKSSYKNVDLFFSTPYYQNYKNILWDFKFAKNTGLAKNMAYLMLEAFKKQ